MRSSYADANEPEEAAVIAGHVILLSSGMASERTTERVRVVIERLKEFADVREVRAVLDVGKG
ncbi:hypothetical protein AB0909_06160 [Streptomyces albidoflavus]|uniref:hypothetical protein n=1 Tax=Streptomyces albidoflavus TaxID=1886 RepID=UPI000A1CCA8E|nr:hypothetical protein [Streptomyces albidoflavus]RZE79810.1 hypothetical protein C0R02_13495 [Streptomyces albidoflavus]